MKVWLVVLLLWVTVSTALAGTLEGKVEIRQPARVKRNPRNGDRYGPGGLKGEAEKRPEGPETENVVISIPDLSTPAPAKSPKITIGQKDKTFIPYLTVIRTGTTVDFPNGDKVFHSVYSESPTQKFHLPEYRQGESHSLTFNKPGHVELFCAIHSQMNAHILILPNEFFTRCKANGDFKLDDLPAGKLKVQAWHPKLGTQVQMVDIPKDGTVKVNFSLK